MSFLYYAHSGLRYLVLIGAVVAIVMLLMGRNSGRPYGGGARAATSAFMGLVHVQVLLGIGLVFTRPWYGALMGHLMMMFLAAVVITAMGAYAKRQPNPRKSHGVALAGVVLTLLLIVGGIMSIRPHPFASAVVNVEGQR